MGYPDIALMGRARSGKDTIAAYLVDRYGYVRVAFADPLREAALKLDPIVTSCQDEPGRLSEIVRVFGWERAKDEYPEVRRLLQHIGQGVRDLDEDFWLRVAFEKIGAAWDAGKPVVVTDCRYPNEHTALGVAGFQRVRVVRLGLPPSPQAHESETALDGFREDWRVYNDTTIADLRRAADRLTAL